MKMFNRSINKTIINSKCRFSFAYADQNIEIVGGNSAGNPKLWL